MNTNPDDELVSQLTEEMAAFRTLFGTNPIRSTVADYYRWKVYKNPFGPGIIHLEQKDGRAVGSATLTRKRVVVDGRPLEAAEIGDTFTHPDYRRQGIFSTCVQACLEYAARQNLDLIYGTPNSQSLPGYVKKFGFVMNPGAPWRKLVKPLASSGSLLDDVTGCLLTRHPIERMRQRRRLAHYQTVRKACLGQAASLGLHIETVSAFSQEVDGLWDLNHPAFCTIRDHTYLRWRFVDNPDAYHILLAMANGVPAGCLVMKLSPSQRNGILCDFVTRHGDKNIFRLLVSQAEQHLVDLGYRSVQSTCIRSGYYYDDLIELGYEDPEQNADRPIIFYGRPEITETLRTRTDWHFTLADSDNI